MVLFSWAATCHEGTKTFLAHTVKIELKHSPVHSQVKIIYLHPAVIANSNVQRHTVTSNFKCHSNTNLKVFTIMSAWSYFHELRWHVYYGNRKYSLPHCKCIVKELATRLTEMTSNAQNSHSKISRLCTSNFKAHSIANLKVLTIFYGCSVCAVFPALVAQTMTRQFKATKIVKTVRYLNREIGLADLGIASFRVAINLHLTTTIYYSMHTAVRNSSFSKSLALLQSFSSRITLKAE